MMIVVLAGFAGVVVFGLLYVVFFFKGISLKLPAIGMAVFALVVAAAVVISMLGLSLPELPALPFPGGGPSQTEQAGGPDEEKTETPGAGGFPQLLLNKRGLVITATELIDAGAQGPVLVISIVNRSETDLTVEVRDASINGWMMKTSFSVLAPAGQRTEGSILFAASGVRRSGIETIAELELFFHILDQNRVAFLDSDAVTVRTPAADTYRSPSAVPGEELYNENGVRVVSGGFSPDEQGLVLFLENTTDRTVTVQARDVLIDGIPREAVFSEDISPLRRSAAVIAVSGVSPEEIREMSFRLRVTDRDRRTVLFDTDPFTIVV